MQPVFVNSQAVWPPLASALFVALLALFSWRHRATPGARSFAFSLVLAIFWLVGIALEAAATAPEAKYGWYKFQSIWQIPAATAITFFILDYSYPGRWLTRRNVSLLAIPSLLFALLIAVDDARLVFARLELGSGGSVIGYLAPPGAFLVGFGLCLLLVNAGAFVWLFIRSPRHRLPVVLILAGQIACRALYLLDLAQVPIPGEIDPVVLAIVTPCIMYAITLYGFRIFDPLREAQVTVLAQMRDGMVVCDDQWHILSLNPAAESALGLTAAHARGMTLQQALGAQTDLPPLDVLAGTGLAQVKLGEGASAQHLRVGHQSLKDFRGLVVGHLLMLHDVTEHKQAEARLLELRWAQATLQERELLAQELHDSLSQSLAFLNLQAQTAQLYIQSGQSEEAGASLARLAAVAREMQGDVRELIGGLLAVSLPTEGFCSAVSQAADRFEEQTGLPVTIEVAKDAEKACDGTVLAPSVAIQLLRIVQEGLANVRRHAGRPDQTAVRLEMDDGQLCLTISDDGTGFDPAAPLGPGSSHYGLQIMRQRAARVGGQLTLESAPGEGTRILVRAPLSQSSGSVSVLERQP